MAGQRAFRDSAAVLLVTGAGAGLQVLLVERSPELRFFGGYHALPGGVVSAEDRATAPDPRAAAELCAVRELFEETGVWLGAEPIAAPHRRELRQALLAGHDAPAPEASLAMTERALRAGARSRLRDVCRFLTPPFAPVRYDTRFLLAELPAGESVEIWTGELTGAALWRPAEALAAWRRGELAIVPPVLLLLELLAREAGDLERFLAAAAELAARYEAGALHRVQFSPGILMASLATPTLPPATTTNCMIVGTERLVVVDPGAPEPAEQARLFALLDELRDEGRTLDSVLLTHHHGDHVGAVAATSRRYDLPVHGHELTLVRLRGEFRRGRVLADRDRLELGRAPDGSEDWHLTAVHTPGHDRGHHCYRDSRYASVLAGDMLSTVSTIVIDPPEGHMATYLASLERLLAEPMGTLYPAHGPALRDGHRLVAQYLRHRRQREAHLIEALARGPATLDELLPAVYWDVDPALLPIARRSLLAGLEKLAEEQRARQDGERWAPA